MKILLKIQPSLLLLYGINLLLWRLNIMLYSFLTIYFSSIIQLMSTPLWGPLLLFDATLGFPFILRKMILSLTELAWVLVQLIACMGLPLVMLAPW